VGRMQQRHDGKTVSSGTQNGTRRQILLQLYYHHRGGSTESVHSTNLRNITALHPLVQSIHPPLTFSTRTRVPVFCCRAMMRLPPGPSTLPSAFGCTCKTRTGSSSNSGMRWYVTMSIRLHVMPKVQQSTSIQFRSFIVSNKLRDPTKHHRRHPGHLSCPLQSNSLVSKTSQQKHSTLTNAQTKQASSRLLPHLPPAAFSSLLPVPGRRTYFF
jgi:hypothetical protein